MKINWKKCPAVGGEAVNSWMLNGIGFSVLVIEHKNGLFEINCDGFSPIIGIADFKAAQKLAATYAKQRVVQLSQQKLNAINALIGE